MSDALPLPPRPDLEQYKKLAKDLQQACRSGDLAAIRDWAARWANTLARLRTHELSSDARKEIHQNQERIERNWQTIQKSNEGVARCTLTGAQFFVARCHGFLSWPKFVKHLEGLARGNSPVATFELAVDAIVAGDVATLSTLLGTHTELVRARSTREHRSTLLHYVSANGVEDFRQKTPPNIVEIAKRLLDAGADVNAGSEAYGGGSTALGLIATSVHPERAGVQEELMQLLLERGAVIDQPGAAGNRHTAVEGCLWNRQGKAAQFLARHGASLSLETAAGAGRLEIVEGFFDESGKLTGSATKEQVQRGFLWACLYGHQETVEFLLDHGADLCDQDGTGATGLHWAASGGHLGIVQLLLGRGAPLEAVNRWGGTVLEQVGWAFAHGDPAADYLPVFEELLRAGAKLQDGWLAWLDKQSGPEGVKAGLGELLRRYGAVT